MTPPFDPSSRTPVSAGFEARLAAANACGDDENKDYVISWAWHWLFAYLSSLYGSEAVLRHFDRIVEAAARVQKRALAVNRLPI